MPRSHVTGIGKRRAGHPSGVIRLVSGPQKDDLFLSRIASQSKLFGFFNDIKEKADSSNTSSEILISFEETLPALPLYA